MQRINFIRAIINNPKILILDEPTSSLDTKNEKKIFNYLKKIKKDKIIILTSHKLSQSKYFDKVIKLKWFYNFQVFFTLKFIIKFKDFFSS